MANSLEYEFKQLIQELTEKICRELLTEDFERLKNDISRLTTSQLTVTRNLSNSSQEFQSMSERAGHGLSVVEENNRLTKEALDYVLRQNQDFITRVESHYASLFAEYKDKISSLKDEEQRTLLASFEQQISLSGSRFAHELQETVIKNNFLPLEAQMDTTNKGISDLLASRDRLFAEVMSLVQKLSKQFLEPPGTKLDEASNRLSEQTVKLLQSITLLNSIVKGMQTNAQTIDVLGKSLQGTQQKLDDLQNIVVRQQELTVNTRRQTEEKLSQMQNTLILQIKHLVEAETEKTNKKIFELQQQIVNMRSIINATNSTVNENILAKLWTEKWVKIGLGVLYGLLCLIFLRGCGS